MQNHYDRQSLTGPYPFPISDLGNILYWFDTPDINITVPKKSFDFSPQPGHSHNSYEFLIPYTPMSHIGVEKRTISVDRNTLIPINPQQPHGPKDMMQGCFLVSIHISRLFLCSVAEHAYDKTNVYFENESVQLDNTTVALMHSFMEEANQKQAGYEFFLECLASQLSINFMRKLKNNLPLGKENLKSGGKESIKKVIEYMNEYYNHPHSSEQIARVANLSTYHFIRTFKSETGKTPQDFLMDIKIKKAREMLQTRNYTVTEICFLCGFTNHSHFTKVFKRKMGISPSDYRKELTGMSD